MQQGQYNTNVYTNGPEIKMCLHKHENKHTGTHKHRHSKIRNHTQQSIIHHY